MQKISDKYVEILIANGVIDQKYGNIYAYGMRKIIINVLYTSVLFILGYMLKDLLFTIIFYLGISVVRSYYGTFHAKCIRNCFFCTIIFYLIALFVYKFIFAVNAKSFDVVLLTLVLCIIYILLNLIKYRKNFSFYVLKKDLLNLIKSVCLLSLSVIAFSKGIYVLCRGILGGFSCTLGMEFLGGFLKCVKSANK